MITFHAIFRVNLSYSPPQRHLMLQMNCNSKYCTMTSMIVTTTTKNDSCYLHNDDHIDVAIITNCNSNAHHNVNPLRFRHEFYIYQLDRLVI